MKKKVTHLKINTIPENEMKIANSSNYLGKSSNIMPDINLNIKGGSPKNSYSKGYSSQINSKTGRSSDNLRPSSRINGKSRSVSRSKKNIESSNSEIDKEQNITQVNSFLRNSAKRKTDPYSYKVNSYIQNLKENENGNNSPTGVNNSIGGGSTLPSFHGSRIPSSSGNLKMAATPKYSTGISKPNILSPINNNIHNEPLSTRNTYYNSFNKNNCKSDANTVNVMSLLSSQHIPLNINILKQNFIGYETSKYSTKSIANIKAYAANTHQGTVRNYNEDRVSIILNIVKPQSYTGDYWPKCSIFGIYDGHGGSACADYLRDNLHQFVIKDSNFPNNPKEAIMRGFENAEKDYLTNYALSRGGDVLDRSGSCAIVAFIIGKNIDNIKILIIFR